MLSAPPPLPEKRRFSLGALFEGTLARSTLALWLGMTMGWAGLYFLISWIPRIAVNAGLPLDQAAALPETLFTVWHNVFQRGMVRDGEVLLVHGGTSGIGTMAISLCRLFDIEIIVTCGSDDKCAQALEWGASHAINYKSQDYVAEVKRITGGQGVQAQCTQWRAGRSGCHLGCL